MDDKYSEFLARAIKSIGLDFPELIAQLRFLVAVAWHMKLTYPYVQTGLNHVCLKGDWLGEPISLIQVPDTEATVQVEVWDDLEEKFVYPRLFFAPDQTKELDDWIKNQ